MRNLIFEGKLYDSSSWSPDKSDHISNNFIVFYNLLSPLAHVTSKEALEDFLKARAFRFRRLKTETEELLWTSLEEHKEQSKELYNLMRKAIPIKADLLGEEALEQLLGAIDSSEGFNNWIIETLERGESGVYRLTSMSQQVGKAPLYADMCIDTLMGIVRGFIPYWTPEAIPLLAQAADDYMAEVEDVFLDESSSAEVSQKAASSEPLRYDVGL
jgi:hypothetical protein